MAVWTIRATSLVVIDLLGHTCSGTTAMILILAIANGKPIDFGGVAGHNVSLTVLLFGIVNVCILNCVASTSLLTFVVSILDGPILPQEPFANHRT